MDNTELTINYYNENSAKFNDDTINVQFSNWQNNFTKYLAKGALILDLGCGSGRDSKAFIEKGYKVLAIDGSFAMCNLASNLIKQDVKCIKFLDINDVNLYDGIWACASILHLSYHELKLAFHKLHQALKLNGYIYASFKYGEFEGLRNNRYFLDMNERKFQKFLKETGGFEIVSENITGDVRIGRNNEKWYNIILIKL